LSTHYSRKTISLAEEGIAKPGRTNPPSKKKPSKESGEGYLKGFRKKRIQNFHRKERVGTFRY